MAITNFIPTIWSEHLLQYVDYNRVAVNHCNRLFEGEIREKGNTVRICGLAGIAISDYQKNADIKSPNILNSVQNDLTIDQAKYFNFMIDDLDRTQSNPKVMEVALNTAASALASEADSYIYNLYTDAGKTLDIDDPTVDNIFDSILDAKTDFFYTSTSLDEIVLEVSPRVASLILKSKVKYATDNTDSFEKGYIGSIGGCKIYVSGNIIVEDEDNGYERHKCFLRTKRAIAFAEQFSEIEAYRPESRFADAVKGLYLFGAKVIVPSEFTVLNFGFETA